jgi:hypothetical protein
MRELDAVKMEQGLSDAIGKSTKARTAGVKSGVYRLLGAWQAHQ